MSRPGLQVKAREIRAFLAEAGADSRLEKAFADGAVEICAEPRTGIARTGTGRAQRVLHRRPESDPAGRRAEMVRRKATTSQSGTTRAD